MVSAIVLINLLLAAAATVAASVVGVPTGQKVSSDYQAGAAYYNYDVGTFTAASGVFVVPSLSGSGDASVWVGIDGHSCGNTAFRTGVGIVNIGGQYSYIPWWQWYDAGNFSNVAVKPGDTVRLNVTTSSPTSGTSSVENLTTGGVDTHVIDSARTTLCERDVAWMVEVPDTLPMFANITFTGALATIANGDRIGPDSYNVQSVDIMRGNKIAVSSSVYRMITNIFINGPLSLPPV